MAFGTQEDDDQVMHEINMTPLVDVMLVLLIIFIVTVPVMKHAVEVELPRATHRPQDAPPQTVRITVDAQGRYFWNDQALDDAALGERLSQAARQDPQPELHIQGDRAARYERVAQLIAAMKRAGLKKVGFVTDPSQAPATP